MDTDREDLDKYRIEEEQDKMCDNCFCEDCGKTPNVIPLWTGQDNYMEGWCRHCEREVTFYHVPYQD